jgi:hypothetical protein
MDSEYDPQYSLHDAAHAGDAEAIGRLLREDPGRVGEPGPSGMQPLHFAASAAAAAVLIRFGALVDARTDWGEIPLHFAARHGHLDVVEVLVGHGADLHAVDDHGNTSLYLAAHGPSPGATVVARYLLSCGAVLDLNSALALRMLDRARRILVDSDACRKAPHPELLLRVAVFAVFDAVMEAVGESEFAIMYRSGVYKLDPEIIDAVVADHIDLLEEILAQGAPMSRWSFEALGMALELPHTAVAELLLQAGAGSPDWADMDSGWLDRRAERSACKDSMRDLLRRYSS